MELEIFPERLERFKTVIAARQFDLTVVLENVHDPHNIGAVLRTCDSIGIDEIYILYTDPRLQKRGLDIGLKSASGAKQWIKVNYFEEVRSCFEAVKTRYDKVYGTKMDITSKSLYDLELSSSCALAFGNEHKGLTEEAAQYLDANFLIPQHGFVQSLNISVACAVTLYEAQRQRLDKGMYDHQFGSHRDHELTYERFKQIHTLKKIPKSLQ